MECRSLGKTGLNVSPICIGTMNFGTPLDKAHCTDLVRYALDNGVNLFDTANVYEGYARTLGSAGGVGEELLGRALPPPPRRAGPCRPKTRVRSTSSSPRRSGRAASR